MYGTERATMPAIGMQEQTAPWRQGFRARDSSPDSVIITLESNFSLFSSASASVERCSFASDFHDHDSLPCEEASLHPAGNDGELQEDSYPDPDPNASKHSLLPRYGEKAKVQYEVSNTNTEDNDQPMDPARNSFSLALRECQDRRSRSEALSRKLDRRRHASLDLNNVTATSPHSGMMRKSMTSSRKSGAAFPSPGMQNGWSSERVPLRNNTNRKHVSPGLLPFSNGKTLPSKWEDAERWIISPIVGDGVVRPSVPLPQRKPKSKSGPLGPPGIANYSLSSPAMSTFEGVNVGNFMAYSPFSAMDVNGLASDYRRAFPVQTEPCMARSVSMHACSKMLSQSSLSGSQGENLDAVKDAAESISPSVSRRDMATQMSPEGSNHSSSEIRFSTSDLILSALPTVGPQNLSSSKLEVKDVQVDEHGTLTRWSKKHKARNPSKGCANNRRKDDEDEDAQFCAWDSSEAAKCVSKVKREEAKIAAWENLQKAKAEAAIRKLEMKLEKKRSSSMDKIMNKLKSAQKKAQKMRSSMSANQPYQITRASHKTLLFHQTRHMVSLSGCFTCPAF